MGRKWNELHLCLRTSSGVVCFVLEGKARIVFRGNLEITRFADLQKDGFQEVIGWGDYRQCSSPDFCTYNPELVLRIEPSSFQIKVDADLSMKINRERHYPWAGVNALQDKMVYKETQFMTHEEYSQTLEREKKQLKLIISREKD